MSPAGMGRLRERALRAMPVWLAALAVVISGCGSGSGRASGATTTTSSADAVTTTHVVMKILEFTPPVIRVKVGQTLTWTNEDSVAHNVTYVSGPQFTSSGRHLSPGSRFSIRVSQAGTIHYVCTLHPWMKGTIIVTP
jgi:amicyanin